MVLVCVSYWYWLVSVNGTGPSSRVWLVSITGTEQPVVPGPTVWLVSGNWLLSITAVYLID